jgi:hypothetical protein
MRIKTPKMPGIVFCLFLVLLSGCAGTGRLSSFTLISTQDMDWKNAPQFIRHEEPVQGEDAHHVLIIFQTKNISIAAAVDNALRRIPGAAALVDATVSLKYSSIPFIYNYNSYIIEGHILVDPGYVSDIPGDSEGVADYLVLSSKDGIHFNREELESTEYYAYLAGLKGN